MESAPRLPLLCTKGLVQSAREELVPAIEEMLAADGPFLLDVHTGYEEHVLPMIPPGGDYTAIIME